uniref:Uncharacterized protein n=1 Tax=Oryza nivara TaxID=4536 RepID=A0A0E0IHX4_ORYNI
MASVIPKSEMVLAMADEQRWCSSARKKHSPALVNCPTKSCRECLLPAGIKSPAVICRRYSKAFTADNIVSGSHLP